MARKDGFPTVCRLASAAFGTNRDEILKTVAATALFADLVGIKSQLTLLSRGGQAAGVIQFVLRQIKIRTGRNKPSANRAMADRLGMH
ncbi:hypothetical protein GCM10023067_54740 [Aminobacter aganoensis]